MFYPRQRSCPGQVACSKNRPRAATLPRTSGLFKKKVGFLRNNSAPGSEAAPDKWFAQKKSWFFENKICPGSKAAPDKWLVQEKVGFLRKRSAPGSAAALDKWLGREKATNRCSQGRGAPFGGSGGRSPPKCRGVWGGAAPLPPPQFDPQFFFKLSIHRPGGRDVIVSTYRPHWNK